ncbi:MAG: hypothetical protein ACREJN_13845 [Nitrospiraceae bacterium]
MRTHLYFRQAYRGELVDVGYSANDDHYWRCHMKDRRTDHEEFFIIPSVPEAPPLLPRRSSDTSGETDLRQPSCTVDFYA